jgi:hypothetical protein
MSKDSQDHRGHHTEAFKQAREAPNDIDEKNRKIYYKRVKEFKEAKENDDEYFKTK